MCNNQPLGSLASRLLADRWPDEVRETAFRRKLMIPGATVAKELDDCPVQTSEMDCNLDTDSASSGPVISHTGQNVKPVSQRQEHSSKREPCPVTDTTSPPHTPRRHLHVKLLSTCATESLLDTEERLPAMVDEIDSLLKSSLFNVRSQLPERVNTAMTSSADSSENSKQRVSKLDNSTVQVTATVKALLTELADISLVVRTWMTADMPNTTDEDNKPWSQVAEHAREAFVFAVSTLDDIVFEIQQVDQIDCQVTGNEVDRSDDVTTPLDDATFQRRVLFGRNLLLDIRRHCIVIIEDINTNFRLFRRSFVDRSHGRKTEWFNTFE